MLLGTEKQRIHWAQMVEDILGKIIIKGMRGIEWTILALNTIVLKKEQTNDNIIPLEFLVKAKSLRSLIDEQADLIPADPSQANDAEYAAILAEDRKNFENLVLFMVEDKVATLQRMPLAERKQLIQDGHQKWIKEQAQRRQVKLLNQKRVQGNKSSVETEEQVMLYDQWRLNLMQPFDEQEIGLNQDEMTRLSVLINQNLYNWEEAQLLTSNLTLAHWLATQQIHDLICEGFLKRDAHPQLLTQPSQDEMDNLKLLHHFVRHKILTVYQATHWDNLNYDLLESVEFQERLKAKNLTASDETGIKAMGIIMPQSHSSNSSMNYGYKKKRY
ncbi:MAG: hypothetical protein JSS07_04365 [Proteobacteria bacterium]|nr:hypothetical protein [Pseudomonadota bacterium]